VIVPLAEPLRGDSERLTFDGAVQVPVVVSVPLWPGALENAEAQPLQDAMKASSATL